MLNVNWHGRTGGCWEAIVGITVWNTIMCEHNIISLLNELTANSVQKSNLLSKEGGVVPSGVVGVVEVGVVGVAAISISGWLCRRTVSTCALRGKRLRQQRHVRAEKTALLHSLNYCASCVRPPWSQAAHLRQHSDEVAIKVHSFIQSQQDGFICPGEEIIRTKISVSDWQEKVWRTESFFFFLLFSFHLLHR